jgi:pimeloyl-ACP methyl ester carboxylesterase
VTTSLQTSIQPRFRTIDGLSIRFRRGEAPGRGAPHALLLSPWPESLYAFEPTWARLAAHAHLVAVDLPGFGHSERCDALLSPRAMGEFVVRLANAFGLEKPHVVGPDIGTGAALFAAASAPGRLRSLVVGSGGAAFPLELGDVLKEWVEAPDLEPYRRVDGRQFVAAAIGRLERYTPSGAAREDYLSAYEGKRFADSMAYVRTYPRDLPALRDLLPGIRTPVLVIAGRRDPVVPRPTRSSSPGDCPRANSPSSMRRTSPGRTPPTSTRRSSRTGGTGTAAPTPHDRRSRPFPQRA